MRDSADASEGRELQVAALSASPDLLEERGEARFRSQAVEDGVDFQVDDNGLRSAAAFSRQSSASAFSPRPR